MPRVRRATPASPSPLWILRDFLSANLFFNLCQVMLLLGVSWTMTSLT